MNDADRPRRETLIVRLTADLHAENANQRHTDLREGRRSRLPVLRGRRDSHLPVCLEVDATVPEPRRTHILEHMRNTLAT